MVAVNSPYAGDTLISRWPPLFERLIYYMLVPELFSKVFIEVGLGISGRALIQPKLYIFYLLVAVEYILNLITLGQRRFRVNVNSLASILLITMFIHGIIVASYWGNEPVKAFTDSIPVLVLALNMILLNAEGAIRNLDFERLQQRVWIFSVIIIFVGIVGVLLHRGTEEVTFGGSGSAPVCMSILLVSLATRKQVSAFDLALVTVLVAPTVPFVNRTTLAVFLIVFGCLVAPRLFRNLKQLYFSVFLVVAAVGAFIAFVPPDSKVVTRVTGLAEAVNSGSGSENGGSLYEREAEWEAINEKLNQLGPVARYFGYGPGGTYMVVFTGGFIPQNYSHAHYSWSLFKLRYGMVGYLYLFCYALLVIFNLIRHSLKRDPLSRLVFVIDIWCVVFLSTYVFFNFLVAGLQFVVTDDEAQSRA